MISSITKGNKIKFSCSENLNFETENTDTDTNTNTNINTNKDYNNNNNHNNHNNSYIKDNNSNISITKVLNQDLEACPLYIESLEAEGFHLTLRGIVQVLIYRYHP